MRGTLHRSFARVRQWATSALWPFFLRSLRLTVKVAGTAALVLIVLACTRLPFDAHRALGTSCACTQEPQAVVVLGGSGMPSGPELRRLQHGAMLANALPAVPVFVVHPPDTGVMRQMVDELVLRGVERGRITAVLHGTNTREQALAMVRLHPELAGRRIALVTAPENMFRSVRTFRRAGCPQVCGEPAWDNPMFIDLAYGHRRIGGKAWMPDVSGETGLRYTFWNYLKLEVTCLREYVAIGYYWLNGWI
ncbi:MAG: YdcF family protein [Flavobacteriales bacterium]|nr:YdcF family protein [Flavobacteriales bacterium]